MFVLKSKSRYVIAAPRIRQNEGMLMGVNKDEAIRFGTADMAREWLNAIRCKQIDQGFKRHELASATVVVA